MAIVPTGAIYKSLVFDGENSRDYGIYITGQAVYNAPERDVEMISIPGRNGSFALDKGRFQNIEVTYPAGIFADNEADFAQGISDFRNFLCSRNGYVRLTDDYNPDEYRMAVYKSGLDVSPAQLKAGEFQLVFDCKPQRYLTSGEEPVTMGEWHETETASGEIASFEAEAGDAVKSLVADIEPIQDLNGYDKPWSGGAGANLIDDTYNGLPYSTEITLTEGTYYAQAFLVGQSSQVNSRLQIYLNDEWTQIVSTPFSADNGAFTMEGSSFGWIYSNALSTISVTSGSYRVRFYIDAGVSETRRLSISKTQQSSWTPYSNICPISGHNEVNVYVSPNTSETDATVYTTDLSGTRYGGTVDVVSGVLTVDRASVDLGSLTWTYNTSASTPSFRATLSGLKYVTNAEHIFDAICSIYATTSYDNAISRGVDSTISNRWNQETVVVVDSRYTDATTFKTAMNGVQLCYELATPQTVQLTAQEVELLVGLNQVWANSGDVEVEYGTAPNVLVNPTLFESSPMLEVTGYGDIQFNGYGISIVNEEYGTVTLKNRFEFGGNNTVYPMPLSNYMAVGDRISIFEVVARFYIDISKAYKGSMQITSALVTSVSEDCTRTITQVAAATLTDNGYVDVILVVRGIAFPFSSAVNNVRERFFIRPNISLTDSNGATHSMTCTLDIQFYDADYASGTRTNKPVFGAYVSFATADQPYFIGIGEAVCSDVVGQSTKSILGTPTYIDCDLGEAYKIEDDTVISLNQYIDLGSDLPKLAVGSNQITFDNTITDLKVVPRWWKI